MRVSTGQVKQLLELDASRPNVGNKMQVFLRDLQQCSPKDPSSRKSRHKGESECHLVDLAATPFIPKGWEVEDHQKGGQFEWDATKVNLFVSVNQQNGNVILGHELRKEFKSKAPFNANLLDFLLAHPNLIPEEWKGKYIYFWGTVYHYRGGDLCVRCLCWDDGRWHWGWRRFCIDWYSHNLAAVSAS